jgi:hypothetical protein
MRTVVDSIPVIIFFLAELALLVALVARKDGEPFVQGSYARGRLGIALALLTGGMICGVIDYLVPTFAILGIAVGAVVSGLGALAAANDWSEIPFGGAERLSVARRDLMVSLVLLFTAAVAAGLVALALH